MARSATRGPRASARRSGWSRGTGVARRSRKPAWTSPACRATATSRSCWPGRSRKPARPSPARRAAEARGTGESVRARLTSCACGAGRSPRRAGCATWRRDVVGTRAVRVTLMAQRTRAADAAATPRAVSGVCAALGANGNCRRLVGAGYGGAHAAPSRHAAVAFRLAGSAARSAEAFLTRWAMCVEGATTEPVGVTIRSAIL